MTLGSEFDSNITDADTENDQFIKNLFNYFLDQFNIQHQSRDVATLIRVYIKNSKRNNTKLFHQIIRCSYFPYITSLVGFFYRFGIGTLIDYKMAFEMFSLAANENTDVRQIFGDNGFSPTNTHKASNKILGIVFLGYLYLYGIGVEKDLQKSFQLFLKATREGSSLAESCLGYCYSEGYGVEKDELKAFRCFQKSTEKGCIVGLYDVAYSYLKGLGTLKDEVKGFKLLLQAAGGGSLNAQNELGICYESGSGVTKDSDKAFEWYLRSAENGCSVGSYNVGCLYYNGTGVYQDKKKAFERFLNSAENDYEYGQLDVGRSYRSGIGTRKDIIKAIYYLEKAKTKEKTETDAKETLEGISDRVILD